MKVLKHLIEKANDTQEEIEWYAEQAMLLKMDNRPLADTYIKIAEMHITIYGMLHDKMVSLIDEEKRKGTQPPKAMLDVWEFEHKRLIKSMAEAKYIIDEYKKSYWKYDTTFIPLFIPLKNPVKTL